MRHLDNHKDVGSTPTTSTGFADPTSALNEEKDGRVSTLAKVANITTRFIALVFGGDLVLIYAKDLLRTLMKINNNNFETRKAA